MTSREPSVHGLLAVDKPAGPSSHDVVVVARRALGVRRIGHTGTLDPSASGVLALVVGQATRLASYFTASLKEYEATIRFGLVTDTYDTAGTVVAESGLVPSASAMEGALERFRGTFMQRPPAYSAKKVDGERAYARARAGTPVEPPAVPVTVYALEALWFDPPRARLRIRCSSGFYVRSLAHDLGQVLGTGAVLEHLVRTETAGVRLDECLPFDALTTLSRDALRAAVRPMESLLPELPAVVLTAEGVEWARHGRDLGPAQLRRPAPGATTVRLFGPDDRLVGLAVPAKAPGFLHPSVIFSYN